MKIEYENQDLIVVNKPAGLPVYSSKNNTGEESVLSWFLQKYPEAKTVGDAERPGIVHRLDKQTSGLLILAKNEKIFEYLKNLFKIREIKKEYLALVYGQTPKHGVIDKALTKIGHEGQSRVRVDEKGKPSVTEYWAKEFYTLSPSSLAGEGAPRAAAEGRGEGAVDPVRNLMSKTSADPRADRISNGVDTFTLIRVKLHTGRTHQIRVHLSHLGHPIMGDTLYGKPLSLKLSSIIGRQFLHASKLEFKLPDGTWLELEADLPDDLKVTLSQLQHN